MLVAFQEKVSVSETDLITLSAVLDNQRRLAVLFAKNAVELQNFGAYIEDRDMYDRADELLKLSMFDGYRDECTETFPAYEDRCTEDWRVVFSDGSYVDDSVDVPF